MTTPDARIEALERELAESHAENERLRLDVKHADATIARQMKSHNEETTRLSRHVGQLLAVIEEEAPTCANCQKKPATCVGAYEDQDNFAPACDDCCGHGNEDGTCEPLAAQRELAAARALLEEARQVIAESRAANWVLGRGVAEYDTRRRAFLSQPPSVSGGARGLETPMHSLLTPGQWQHARWVLVPSVSGGAAYQEEPGRDYRKERDAAYVERNRLVAALARLFPSWLADHRDVPGDNWDPEWRTVVFIEGPTGQLSWHLHDSDVSLFDGLPRGENTWDGHTTVEKYERVARIRPAPTPAAAPETAPEAEKLDANGERWAALAMVYGYNELAKLGKTLGEKVYFRLARGEMEEAAERLGCKIQKDDAGNVVLEMPQRPPYIVFHERDIELMRSAVADFDAREAPATPAPVAPVVPQPDGHWAMCRNCGATEVVYHEPEVASCAGCGGERSSSFAPVVTKEKP